MFDDVMKIFESEFEFKAFMLQIANDYEKKYFRKSGNDFYFIKDKGQLLAVAHAYKDFLDNANEKTFKSKIKQIFAGSPVVKFTSEYEEKNAPEKKYMIMEIVLMIVIAAGAFGYAIFFADVLTERVVLSMGGFFLLISPFFAIRGRILKFLKKK